MYYCKPTPKLRNPERRIRAFNKWVSEFTEYPEIEDEWDEKYQNWKIPVDSRLVQGKYATDETKKACVDGLLKVLDTLSKKQPEDSDAKITALIEKFDMFGSEICIFNSLDYYNGFFDREDEEQSWRPLDDESRSLAKELNLEVPEGITERAYVMLTHDPDLGTLYDELWVYEKK